MQFIAETALEKQYAAPLSSHDVEGDVAHHFVVAVAAHHDGLVFIADGFQCAIHLKQRFVVEE